MLAIAHRNPYWLPCPLFDGSIVTLGHGLVERAGTGLDDWGVGWEERESRSDSFPVRHPITSLDMVESHPMPDARNKVLCERLRARSRGIDRKRAVVFGDNGWGLFERAWLLLGMRRFFIWSHQHPEALRTLLERIAEVKMALTQRLIEEGRVDVVGYGDDWGMEDRPLLSPKQWRSFIKPLQTRLYRAAKEGGVQVFQHSDGRVEDLVPDLVEIGVDILNVQRECNDWRGLMRRHAEDITLWGGVSARTLDLGEPEEIAGEVKECCLLGRNGGIILAPGHSLKYPVDKIEVMRRTWLAHGSYGAGDPGIGG